MKLINLIIFFVLIAAVNVIQILGRVDNLESVSRLQLQYNMRFDNAIEDAVHFLVEVDSGREIQFNKDAAIQNFYQSLAMNFNLMDDKKKKAGLKMHIPFVLVTEQDGYYILHQERMATEEGVQLVSVWSPKVLYHHTEGHVMYQFHLGTQNQYVRLTDLETGEVSEGYRSDLSEEMPNDEILCEEQYFDEVRRNTIINLLTEAMKQTVNDHNYVVKDFGLTYRFILPNIEKEEWYRTIDDIGFFTLFQGYPYGTGTKDVFNRYVFSGARSYKSRGYSMETNESGTWYHKINCPLVVEGEIIYGSKKECVLEGAYPCTICKP